MSMSAPEPVSLASKMWRSSFKVAVGIHLFFVLYIFLYDGHYDFISFVKTFAGTANILFALSLSLSSFGYFFNFLDTKILYRKYLGLLGYFSALIYTVLLPASNPERYFYGFFDNFWSSDILLGTAAMAIFTGMALISTDKAMLAIGPVRWRHLLRLGYLAFFLLVVRAVLNQALPVGADGIPEMWLVYLDNPDHLPPPRLLFSLIALMVIAFRLSVELDKLREKRKVTV